LAGTDKEVKPVPIAEVKEILTKASEDREELLYEQKIALEHAQKFGRISVKDTKEMIKELVKLDLFEERHACKVADLLPLTVDEVTAIFAKEKVAINDEKAKKIIDIVKKYY
jgi:DNA-directed RNA polymerase subunit F